jgi:hypothetical protein
MSEQTKEKKKQSYIKHYGVDHPSKSEEIKLKKKETCISNFGVESPLQSEKVLETMKNNNLEKYGVEYCLQVKEFRDKGMNTCLEKYGVEHYIQTKECQDKIKQTCLEKYGVEHSSQSIEIMDKITKSSYKLKDYIFSSGKINKIQGYEHYALDELIKNEKIDELYIITGIKNVPTIWYNDENGKKHRHYVDIYISSQNRCIEIKSTWTAEKNKHNIFLKQNAAKELGYKYEIWVYDKKGVMVEKYE